jgi:hypothetical protein
MSITVTTQFTIGAFLDAVFSVSTSRSTVEGYATAFRKIVADVFGFASDPAKIRSVKSRWNPQIMGIFRQYRTEAKATS